MGVVLDCRIRFSVSSSWGRRHPHWRMEKSVATPAMMLKKCCLTAWILNSATLRRWKCGGTSSSAQFFCIRFSMLSDHLLSIIWHCGVMPVALILLRRVIYPLCTSVPVLFFNGVTRVALVLTSIMTMMHMYPRWEWNGKRPVWSEYFLFFASYNLK